MNADRPQAYYTAVFLHVSFQAIKHSMAGRRDEALPCWLDTDMLMMLSRELQDCRAQVGAHDAASQPLDVAIYQCGLLLARCPGGLTSRHCHQHLDAILGALHEATAALAAAPTAPAPDRWLAARRRLRQPWRR